MRNVLELAELRSYRTFREVVDEVHGLDAAELRAVLDRAPGHHGTGKVLRLLLSIEGGVARSWLERRLGPFLAAGGLPPPDARNEVVAGFRVDAVFIGPKLLIELDSRSWHSRQAEMRRDRKRDRAYAADGWTCARLMPEELEPEWAADTYDDLAKLGLRRGSVRLRAS